MDGFIFILFFLFFVLPFLRRLNKSAKKTTRQFRNLPKKANPWGMDHRQGTQKPRPQAQQSDAVIAFPEDHAVRVRKRDMRDRKELLRMELDNRSKKNQAMTRVSNKSRSDWGARGESGISSSKSIMIFVLLLVLAHFILVAVAPDLIPGN